MLVAGGDGRSDGCEVTGAALALVPSRSGLLFCPMCSCRHDHLKLGGMGCGWAGWEHIQSGHGTVAGSDACQQTIGTSSWAKRGNRKQ